MTDWRNRPGVTFFGLHKQHFNARADHKGVTFCAELAVLAAIVRVSGLVLLPKQLQRHAFASELVVDVAPPASRADAPRSHSAAGTIGSPEPHHRAFQAMASSVPRP